MGWRGVLKGSRKNIYANNSLSDCNFRNATHSEVLVKVMISERPFAFPKNFTLIEERSIIDEVGKVSAKAWMSPRWFGRARVGM